jgi:hypothetical protein
MRGRCVAHRYAAVQAELFLLAALARADRTMYGRACSTRPHSNLYEFFEVLNAIAPSSAEIKLPLRQELSNPPAMIASSQINQPVEHQTKKVPDAGSFNGWKRPFPMRRIAGGDDLVRSVLLPPGPTEFKFVTDGEWRYSPRDPVASDQGLGTVNNCKMVQVNSSIAWRSTRPDHTVFVTGSFLAWSELVPLNYTSEGVYTAHCCLPVRTRIHMHQQNEPGVSWWPASA